MFPPGSKPGYIKNITIMILSDKIVENTESFQLGLLYGSSHVTNNYTNIENAAVNILDETGWSTLPSYLAGNISIY